MNLQSLTASCDALYLATYSPELVPCVIGNSIEARHKFFVKRNEPQTVAKHITDMFPQIETHLNNKPWSDKHIILATAASRIQQLMTYPNQQVKAIAEHVSNLPKLTVPFLLGNAYATFPPEKTREKGGPVKVENRYFYTYPPKCNHNENALIFAATQIERLLSLIVLVVQTVSKIFRISLKSLNRFHYFSNKETSNQIYDSKKNSPPIPDPERFSSYWIGHATCLFSIPVIAESGTRSTISIITDPVEGDLFPGLYPRMTQPALKLNQCPPIHICMLSHNHMDHFNPASLKKLLGMNPLMIVPPGDGPAIRNLGFSKVVELGWFEKQVVSIEDQKGNIFSCSISSVPANHCSGNARSASHASLFNGYVVQSDALDGDIYFAGDTARLNDDHTKYLGNSFDIHYNFQPGGPDNYRLHMFPTHQCSADALCMHMHLIISRAYNEINKEECPDFSKLKEQCSPCYTIFMHNKTFKLGTLHFDDTNKSISRILNWLTSHNTWEVIQDATLEPYEQTVLEELSESCKIIRLAEGPLQPQQLAELFTNNIIIPKIGANFVSHS